MKKQITTEDDVKKLVKEWFDRHEAWSFAPVQTGFGAHGIHDRIGCVPIVVTPEMVGRTIGLFVSVEAKSPGRRNEPRAGMSVHQQRNLDEIQRAGGASIVCDSLEDLEYLEEVIQCLTS
jgi:hypothetical protein